MNATTPEISSPDCQGESQTMQGLPDVRKVSAPLVYTVEEAAIALNVSTKTIRRLLQRGILTSSKAVRKKLIPRQQLEEFLKATCDKPKRLW